MDYKLELVLIPQAKKFCLEEAGFDPIVDTPIGEGERVVQPNPPGWACSIGFGAGLTSAGPGVTQRLHLVVSDILATRAELIGRGVAVSAVRHPDSGTWIDGPHPERADHQSFADFKDPDGNIWIVRKIDQSKASHGPR
jgi:hypothetical protein